MIRSVFFVSDGTGITAETLGRSLLAQFDTVKFKESAIPYVDSEEKARSLVAQINQVAEADGIRPIIIDTIVNRQVRDIIATANAFMLDVFETYLSKLEIELSAAPPAIMIRPTLF